MRMRVVILCLVVSALTAGCARPTGRGSESGAASDSAAMPSNENVSSPVRISPEGADAAEPAVAAGGDGAVYVAWVEHRGKDADVFVARVNGEGRPDGSPVRVNPVAGEAKAWHGDAPTLAVAPDGALHVGWTGRVEAAGGHASNLYLSTSRDGGRSFASPVKVNDDQKPGVHGMHSLAVSAGGRVNVAWLDERNVAPPPADGGAGGKHGHKESNREVFFASSADGGRTFSPNRSVAREVCPCCKTSLAAAPDGRVYVGWRQVLPGEFRHIAVASTADGGQTFSEPAVVSDDRWMIAGCPVSGAGLAVGADGALRVLWYTAGEAGAPGLYWSESRDGGRTFGPRRVFGESGGRGTPTLLPDGGNGFVAVWEGSGVNGRPLTARLSGEGDVGGSTVLAAAGDLPAATRAAGHTFVAFILKNDEGLGVWIVWEQPAFRS
jgi:hypothetical protein